MGDRVYPFHCGSQFADWQDRNCQRCAKYNPDTYTGDCDLDEALFEAQMGDGSMAPEMATRLGYTDETRDAYGWDCPERDLRAGA